MSETHENAFKMEADEMRRQAATLLGEAERLDPTPVEKPAKEVPETSLKSQPKK
jgi:hypothetical protein